MTRAEARELMAGDKLVVTCEEAGGGIGGHSIPIGSEVKFVEYDFTFGQTEEVRAAALADGLGPVFDRYAKATGFTILYDPQTEEVIDILTASHSTSAMRAAIARSLAIAEDRKEHGE